MLRLRGMPLPPRRPRVTTTAERRQLKRADAAAFLDEHSGPVMAKLVDVIGDLSDEVEGLRQFEQDAAYAAELAYRLDNAIALGDPLLEALDGIVAFFVALAAIGIYRAIARREKLRGARLDRLRDRLEARGPRMARANRMRLERRIKRLESPS